MKKIRICCNRGTTVIEFEPKPNKEIDYDQHFRTRISKEKNGLHITASKGTSTLWIEKVPRVVMYYPKIIIHSRGTRRIAI